MSNWRIISAAIWLIIFFLTDEFFLDFIQFLIKIFKDF